MSILLFTAISFAFPMTQRTRYLLTCRLYMLSKTAFAPFIMIVTQVMYGSLHLRREQANPFFPSQKIVVLINFQQWLQTGMLYQCLVFVFLFICLRIIYSYNGIDPPKPESRFRMITMIISACLLIGFFCQPFWHTHIAGFFGEMIQDGKNDVHAYYLSDGFKLIPKLDGLEDYSFYFWFWVIFGVILPVGAVVMEIIYQAMPNESTLYLSKQSKWFYIYDVFCLTKFVGTVNIDAQNRYNEEHNMAQLCAQCPADQICYDRSIHIVTGLWLLLASVFFWYLDDIKNIVMGCFQSHERRQTGDGVTVPYTSLDGEVEAGTTNNV